MKLYSLLLILISFTILSKPASLNIEANKNLFFIFSSDTPYEIKSSNENCITIDKKHSKSKEVFQKAIYIKSINHDKCKDSSPYLTIRYGELEEYILDILFSKGESVTRPYLVTHPKPTPKEVNTMFTPSGILMIEIITKNTRKQIPTPPATEQAPLQGGESSNLIPLINTDNSKYKITFPWLCLEYCGGDSGAEIAEFARNKAVLSSVSYEKYTMDAGSWTILNLTDPTTTINDNNLTAWPMIRSDSRNYSEDDMANNLDSIWNNRETLATKMVNDAVNNNYKGYCMDIEFQTTRDSTRDKYMDIVNFFADKLHTQNKKLMVAHAHWASMAPMARLKETSVDFVATMDPYTASDLFFKKNNDETQGQAYEDYNQIEHNRLIWGFAWENHVKSTQEAQWEWLQTNGYNEGVVGAAVWRAPAENSCKSGCNTSSEGINYYDAFEHYYPIDPNANTICDNVSCSNHGICQELENQASCNCYEGYHSEGLECIKDIETCNASITCSNHGVCDDSTGIVKCNCDEGFISTGLECISNVTTVKKIIKTISSESFKISGALPYFHNDNIGIDNKSIFCYQSNIDSENKFALTFYGIEAGKYRVFSYIPDVAGLSSNVNYGIKNGSEIKSTNINQISNKNDWAYLGEFNIDDNIELSISCYDENISLDSFKKIYFSAIKLELLKEE